MLIEFGFQMRTEAKIPEAKYTGANYLPMVRELEEFYVQIPRKILSVQLKIQNSELILVGCIWACQPHSLWNRIRNLWENVCTGFYFVCHSCTHLPCTHLPTSWSNSSASGPYSMSREWGAEHEALGIAECRTRGGEMLPTLLVGWWVSVMRSEEVGCFCKVVGVSIVAVSSLR